MKNTLLNIRKELHSGKPNLLKIDAMVENLLKNGIIELFSEEKTDIIDFVKYAFCLEYKIEDWNYFLKRQFKENNELKFALCYFFYNDLNLSMKSVAKTMHKDHSTIYHQIKMFNQESGNNERMQKYYNFLKKAKYQYYKK